MYGPQPPPTLAGLALLLAIVVVFCWLTHNQPE